MIGRYALFALLCLPLLQACEQNTELQIQAPENKYIVCRGSALYLDNGRKWKTNPETTEGIDKMIAQVNALPPQPDLESYHRLGNALMEDFIYIVNYCAEMGENHEMVHAYLNPMQELIVPLQVSGLEVCETQLVKLKEHLDRYHQYFE